MAYFKDYADQLQQEVVTDMAEAYFGARKDIEDMTMAFNVMTEELREQGPHLSQAAARLHCLLLDRDTAKKFYVALDALPSSIPFTEEAPQPFFDRFPFAFSGLGRYERSVFLAYDLLQKAVDSYLNGRYFDDPDQKGRKRLTVHYIRLKALAEHINEEIVRVNSTSLGGTLHYVKAMDPELLRREQAMGEAKNMDDETALNQDMQFTLIDFEKLGLPVVQDLPPLHKVKEAIKAFCKEIYPLRKHDIVSAMESLRSK